MKLRLMIALAIIALVLGMALAACDDGDLPVIKDTTKNQVKDAGILGSVDGEGRFTGTNPSTTGATTPGLPTLPVTSPPIPPSP